MSKHFAVRIRISEQHILKMYKNASYYFLAEAFFLHTLFTKYRKRFYHDHILLRPDRADAH